MSSSLKIAGQWRSKKDVIDKWRSGEALKRVAHNIRTYSKKEENNLMEYHRQILV
jgi:hypothetical protein